MIYLILNTDAERYELCADFPDSLVDISVQGMFYHKYPPTISTAYTFDPSDHATLSDYFNNTSHNLLLINSFLSVDDYNQFLDDSPELFL